LSGAKPIEVCRRDMMGFATAQPILRAAILRGSYKAFRERIAQWSHVSIEAMLRALRGVSRIGRGNV
jgi:hypothetical protein